MGEVQQLGPCDVLKAVEYAVHANDEIGSSTALVVGICEDRAVGVRNFSIFRFLLLGLGECGRFGSCHFAQRRNSIQNS